MSPLLVSLCCVFRKLQKRHFFDDLSTISRRKPNILVLCVLLVRISSISGGSPPLSFRWWQSPVIVCVRLPRVIYRDQKSEIAPTPPQLFASWPTLNCGATVSASSSSSSGTSSPCSWLSVCMDWISAHVMNVILSRVGGIWWRPQLQFVRPFVLSNRNGILFLRAPITIRTTPNHYCSRVMECDLPSHPATGCSDQQTTDQKDDGTEDGTRWEDSSETTTGNSRSSQHSISEIGELVLLRVEEESAAIHVLRLLLSRSGWFKAFSLRVSEYSVVHAGGGVFRGNSCSGGVANLI